MPPRDGQDGLSIPAHYYHQFQIDGRCYSRDGGSQIAVERVLAHEPDIFITSGSISEPKPKTLVINDWSLILRKDAEIAELVHTLRCLLQRKPPFTCYLWQAGELVLLTLDNVHLLQQRSVRANITPVSRKWLNQIVANKGISQDSYICLDESELRQLVSKKPQTRGLRISYLMEVRESFGDAYCWNVINRYKEDHDSVIFIDDVSSLDLKEWQKVINSGLVNQYQAFKEALSKYGQIEEAFLSIEIADTHVFKFWFARFEHDPKCKGIYSLDINFDKLSDEIKSNKNILNHLASCLFQLRHLSIKNLDLEPLTLDTPLLELHSLSLKNVTISESKLAVLLSKMPNLKHLSLENCIIKESKSLTEDLSLPKLDELSVDMEEGEGRLDNLMNALSQKGIKNITVRHYLLPYAAEEPVDVGGVDTEYLILKDTNLPSTSLCERLAHCPNIRYLHMYGAFVTDEQSVYYLEPPLYRLTTLKFDARATKSMVSFEHVLGLLLYTPNITTLDIGGGNVDWQPSHMSVNIKFVYQNYDVAQKNKKFLLTKLESLNLVNSRIPVSQLELLLLQAPNLKILNLKGWQALENGMLIEQLPLDNLSHIDLTGSNISVGNLSHLLNHTACLKRLVLRNWRRFGNDTIQFGSRFTFNSLEELDLSNTILKLSELLDILQRAPQLNILRLDNATIYNDLNGDITSLYEFINLPNLQTLSLRSAKLGGLNLAEIIGRAQNLVSIEMTRAIGFTFDSDKTPIFPTMNALQHCDMGETNIDGTVVNELIEQSPQLRIITLTTCQKLNSGRVLKKDQLSLQRLLLRNADVSVDLLVAYLSHLPKLRYLEIAKTITGNEQLLAELPLHEELEELRCYMIELSTSSIYRLLESAPNLKNLVVHRAPKYRSEGVFMFPPSLENLEEVSLRTINMSASDFVMFLNRQTNLKRLSFQFGSIKGKALNHDAIIQLSALKYCHLSETEIDIEFLHQLIMHMPNINELTLSLNQVKQLLDLMNTEKEKAWLKRATRFDDMVLEENHRSWHQSEEDNESILPVVPLHDPSDNYSFSPTRDDFKFRYKGNNKHLDQSMVIEQISQYLTLKGSDQALIPKIQDGICQYLVDFFSSIDDKAQQETDNKYQVIYMDEFLNSLRDWNGAKLDTLTSTHDLERLIELIKKSKFSPKLSRSIYLADKTAAFIQAAPSGTIIKLVNPWHQVMVKVIGKNQWAYYDPNSPHGIIKVESFDKLMEFIDTSLGKHIGVVGYQGEPEKITDKDAFIRDGGLLWLTKLGNDLLVEQISLNDKVNEGALEGLFIRSVKGVPAWFRCMVNSNDKVRNLAFSLLKQYYRASKTRFWLRVEQSFECLSDDEKKRAMQIIDTLVDELEAKDKEIFEANITISSPKVISRQRSTADKMSRKKQFKDLLLKNMARQNTEAQSINALANEVILDHRSVRHMIECGSSVSVNEHICALKHQAKLNNQAFFYVGSPRDLRCSGPHVSKQTVNGQYVVTMDPGQGGPLVDFIKDHKNDQPPALIVIDYRNFKAKDIVAFNSLLDERRVVDGYDLGRHIKIVGMVDMSSEDCYKGEDLYSRFDKRSKASPITQKSPIKIFQLDTHSQKSTSPYVIELFHSPNWRNKLLGHYDLNGSELIFVEGELIKALRSNQPIHISNGLWADKDFYLFWQQLLIDGEFEGESLENVYISKSNGYDWARLISNSAFVHVPEAMFYQADYFLNPLSLNDFISRYHCVQGQLIKGQGIIAEFAEQHADSDASMLTIHVNESLSADEWAMVFTEAEQYGVRLNLQLLPGVRLPESFDDLIDIDVIEAPSKAHINVFVTNDIDLMVSELLSKHAQNTVHVVEAAECGASDIFKHVDGTFHDESLQFRFTETQLDVLRALEGGEVVILKGPLSHALSLAVLPYIKKYHQQLFIINDDARWFNSIPFERVDFDHKAKLNALKEHHEKMVYELGLDEDSAFVDAHSYAELVSLCQFYEGHLSDSTKDLDAPWQPLAHLKPNCHFETFSIDSAKASSQAFTKHRLNQITEAFNRSPIICLSGITGVGKSTFVVDTLSQHGHNIFLGEDNVLSWATNKEGGTLFIDESNITQRQWSEFEGLFNDPKTILVDGRFYPLTDNHRVIFAFNPSSYNHNRQVPSLFKRHPNTVVFDPLTPSIIYQEILLPLIQNTPLKQHIEAFSEAVLSVYEYLCKLSVTGVLITPRELKTIAMLAISNFDPDFSGNFIDYINHYIHQVAFDLVPASDRANFIAQFPVKTRPSGHRPPALGHFKYTDSRIVIRETMDDFLALRKFRQDNAENLSDSQKFGGLGGLILEGEPGLGKSHLIQSRLSDWGLVEGDVESRVANENVYYQVSVSMSQEEKERILLKAFDEGAVVVVDEINCMPMMERLLNDLLMGKRPAKFMKGDLADKPYALKPGFLLMATENPISMPGRQSASGAISRRVKKVNVPLYTADEMKTILCDMGVTAEEAALLIEVFLEERQQATLDSNRVMPCFRHLLKTAREHIGTQLLEKHPFLKDFDASIRQTILSINQQLTDGERAILKAISKDKPSLITHFLDACRDEHKDIDIGKVKSLCELCELFDDNDIAIHLFGTHARSVQAMLGDLIKDKNLPKAKDLVHAIKMAYYNGFIKTATVDKGNHRDACRYAVLANLVYRARAELLAQSERSSMFFAMSVCGEDQIKLYDRLQKFFTGDVQNITLTNDELGSLKRTIRKAIEDYHKDLGIRIADPSSTMTMTIRRVTETE